MNKYRAQKTERRVNGETVKFPSRAEASHYDALYKRLKAGKIEKLTLQPTYVISTSYTVNTTKTKSGKSKIGKLKYTPDFKYTEKDRVIVVEVKGKKTEAYQMRKKLFIERAWVEYGVDEFIEVVNGESTRYFCDSVIKEKGKR